MCKILISTSLFYYNKQSIKYNDLYKNIVNTFNILSDYDVDLVIYYDNTVPTNIINDLKETNNVILVKKNISVNRSGCFWRYEAYDDFKNYDIYFFRDIDISLEVNDLYIIQDFLKSDRKIFYIFIVHTRKSYPKQGFLMGGMFGMKKNVIESFKSYIELYNNEKTLGYYGSDEEFLAKKIYPLKKSLIFIEPRVKNAKLTDSFFNKINLDYDHEKYIFLKDNYNL
jgi:hypothetical protein